MEVIKQFKRINTSEIENNINNNVLIIGIVDTIGDGKFSLEVRNKAKVSINNVNFSEPINKNELIEVKGTVINNNTLNCENYTKLPGNNFNLEIFEKTIELSKNEGLW